MKILNTHIYGLENSMVRSGFPMMTEVTENMNPERDVVVKRGKKLGNATPGSGHDCFLKGIIVQADFEAPLYWWKQFQRYHFADIISSQSTMHRITKMDLKVQCNKYVWKQTVDLLEKTIKDYNEETDENIKKIIFHEIVSNVPSGLNLTAGITTNYLQLKTIYNQRKNHKLLDWTEDFIPWCEKLPMFSELCLGGK